MEWFRNLFKSHAQKRLEQRHREEELHRQKGRVAAPADRQPGDVGKVEKLTRVA
ncbi:MAG: hypothetical protein P8Y69_09280 [Gammaproteobacteria bacterium]|jgi:hypothetical protein